MMFFMNIWALVVLTVAAHVTGQWVEGLSFCCENPTVVVSEHELNSPAF